MSSNPRASGAPRWAWAVMWLSLGAGGAALTMHATSRVEPPPPVPAPPLIRGFNGPLGDRLGVGSNRPGTTTTLEDALRRLAFDESFDRCKHQTDCAASLTAQELRNLLEKLAELTFTNVPGRSGLHSEMLQTMTRIARHALVVRLGDEAKSFAAAPETTPRQGIRKYAEAEDYVRKAMLDAKQAKSPDEAAYTDIFKSLLAESDAYSKRVLAKEFVDSIPWKDLLSGEMASSWSRTTTNSGSACRVENGVLTTQPGVFGILDQKYDNLRHFMLDMEFAVDGVATMFFHVSPPPQNPDSRLSPTYDLSSKGDSLKPNERYGLVATCIGSDIAIRFMDSDKIPGWEIVANWTQLRRGGIAFLIPESTKLRITRMRIRDLR